MVSLGDGITQQLESSPTLPSVTSVSGPLSISLARPLSTTIVNIIPSFKSAPSTHLICGLRWCKNTKTRVRHEFLLLEVERLGICNVWLRLDRRPDKDASLKELFFSDAKSDDSVEMCDNPAHLWDESESEILVVTHFKDPPHLAVLGDLLSVIEMESCKYKVYPHGWW
ncbi:hypothetical protein BS47DRAFT_1380644 [Hydnum rufescens UP504]|uniref:Uncharacterized protein n=1 Tax=Hydnum rufescens UP504 TaxID=1448309 RepID=A0A9P6B3K7_9AGAM|nr:hypothetical protein BS47DRAFT_1380644 [Hydnum rufescens UP504]